MPTSLREREKSIEELVAVFGSVRNFREILTRTHPQQMAELHSTFLTAVEAAYYEGAEKIVLKLAKGYLTAKNCVCLRSNRGYWISTLRSSAGKSEKI